MSWCSRGSHTYARMHVHTHTCPRTHPCTRTHTHTQSSTKKHTPKTKSKLKSDPEAEQTKRLFNGSTQKDHFYILISLLLKKLVRNHFVLTMFRAQTYVKSSSLCYGAIDFVLTAEKMLFLSLNLPIVVKSALPPDLPVYAKPAQNILTG